MTILNPELSACATDDDAIVDKFYGTPECSRESLYYCSNADVAASCDVFCTGNEGNYAVVCSAGMCLNAIDPLMCSVCTLEPDAPNNPKCYAESEGSFKYYCDNISTCTACCAGTGAATGSTYCANGC